MKNRIIFSTILVLFGTIFFSLNVKAENLSNCHTIFNGKCLKNNTLNNIQVETPQISNPIPNISPVPVQLTSTKTLVENDCKIRYGIQYDNDYINGKFFVIDIANNSPASRSGLQIGDEILSINDKKAKKLSMDQMHVIFDQGNTANLKIKDIFGNKKEVSITKANVCEPKSKKDELFETYWQQIDPKYKDGLEEEKRLTKNFLKAKGLSWQARDLEYKRLKKLNYLLGKREKLYSSYNICKSYVQTPEELHSCISQAVNKLQLEIVYEEEAERKQEYLEAQQRMQQQQIDAMNNYANALRNQNVNVNTNTYHSGTVNVNSNVNGNYYHHW